MNTTATGPALQFRWIVFLLALGYWLYQFTTTSLDAFGWQFRFLTIWGLTANVIVAWRMLRVSLGRTQHSHNTFVSSVIVLNIMVLFLYWKLWFTDPSLVNSSGPIVWYQEYYLHGVGPLLMMADAFLILGAFRRVGPTVLVTLSIFFLYILWIEFAVSPLNSFPEGTATQGLPYPFLNDMELNARLIFYGTTIVTALVFLGLSWALALLLRKFR